jgi:hypothetical protein
MKDLNKKFDKVSQKLEKLCKKHGVNIVAIINDIPQAEFFKYFVYKPDNFEEVNSLTGALTQERFWKKDLVRFNIVKVEEERVVSWEDISDETKS